MSRRSLKGRSVIVTGGGTGIGAATAALLASEGARVTICGRTQSKLDSQAAAIQTAGGEVTTVLADVTVEHDVARLMDVALEFGGAIHGLVANAGGGGGLGPYHLQQVDEFVRVLHLNVVGTMLCIKHAVGPMASAGGGSFVGMSSIAGHVTHPYFGAYTASKAAIETMMRNAADEYGSYHVRFNAIQPGFISTEVMEAVPRGGAVWNSYLDQTPLRGVGEPQDVAHVARFLLSDESRWVTGQSFAVDGGHFLRRGPDWSAAVERTFGQSGFDPRNSM